MERKMPEFCEPVPPMGCGCLPGMNPYEAMNNLAQLVNRNTLVYNEALRKCYSTLDSLLAIAEDNGAYYSANDVSTETGYWTDSKANYTIVRVKKHDKNDNPIKLKLALSYDNTTNSGLTQPIFDVSKNYFADKIVNAGTLSLGKWEGVAVWNGAIINTSLPEDLVYSMAITKDGVLKMYPSTTPAQTLVNEGVENAIGVSSLLINNGMPVETTDTTIAARVGCGMNASGELVFVNVGKNSTPGNVGIKRSEFTKIFQNYGCNIAFEINNGNDALMLDKGAVVTAPSDNETVSNYCFWYISKADQYTNDYQRELALTVQQYGEMLWETAQATKNFLPTTGGTITGNLNIAGNVSIGENPTITGITITTDEMGNNDTIFYGSATTFSAGNSPGLEIHDVVTPTNDRDAANKAYVDSIAGGSNFIITTGNSTLSASMEIYNETVTPDAANLAWTMSTDGHIIIIKGTISTLLSNTIQKENTGIVEILAPIPTELASVFTSGINATGTAYIDTSVGVGIGNAVLHGPGPYGAQSAFYNKIRIITQNTGGFYADSPTFKFVCVGIKDNS